MKIWHIYVEGYQVNEHKGRATFMGSLEAETFRDAVVDWVDTLEPEDRYLVDVENLTFWGCGLFDNLEDAQKSFG